MELRAYLLLASKLFERTRIRDRNRCDWLKCLGRKTWVRSVLYGAQVTLDKVQLDHDSRGMVSLPFKIRLDGVTDVCIASIPSS